MPGTHSTPFLRGQALPVSPIKESKKIMEDLHGLTLTESLFRRNGYRMEAFTEGDLQAMRHCKTCGLRVNEKAEKRRRKPNKGETEREMEREKERIQRRNKILERKLLEVLPELEKRKGIVPQKQSVAGTSSSLDVDALTNPWWGCVPLGIYIEVSNHVVLLAPAIEENSRHRHQAYWRNEAEQWVKFVFTLKESELVFFEETPKSPRMVCQSHPGRVNDGRFTCCNKRPNEPGCVQREFHGPIEEVHEFREDMRLFETPSRKARDQRHAIALDCEMGISQRGESELIWIAAVDFFSGEVLLDSLVYPRVPMKHLSTRYSGVNWGILRRAKSARQCLLGRDEARRRLFQWVGPETIVLTHGGKGDFLALRWIHWRVVDTLQVESRRESAEVQRALSHLMAVHLRRSIQKGRGHDCLEDTIACRDLAKWYVDNLPDKLKVRVEDDVWEVKDEGDEELSELRMEELRLEEKARPTVLPHAPAW